MTVKNIDGRNCWPPALETTLHSREHHHGMFPLHSLTFEIQTPVYFQNKNFLKLQKQHPFKELPMWNTNLRKATPGGKDKHPPLWEWSICSGWNSSLPEVFSPVTANAPGAVVATGEWSSKLISWLSLLLFVFQINTFKKKIKHFKIHPLAIQTTYSHILHRFG